MSGSKVSVVVPVYGNAATLEETVARVIAAVEGAQGSPAVEVVLVDDGSPDDSWREIVRLHDANPDKVHALKLSRNFGQLAAILAGYRAATGDAVITVSADLQDPIELMADMVARWRGGSEIVICHRSARDDGWFASLGSRLAYWLARLTNPRIPKGGFDYLLLSRRAADHVIALKGRHRFFQGEILSLGYSVAFIPYVRRKREQGRPGWSFAKKLKYTTDIMLDASYLPIRFISGAGMVTALCGVGYAIVIAWARLRHETPFEGWAPIMVSILVVGGVIMFMLGILGEYLWRLYDEVRARPLFYVEESRGPGPAGDGRTKIGT